ncbi:DUF732 domain-containing protein [Corynebacterium uberis]|uniref:DUF732 domain-containing protein n=1 Tax=Corynebacterium uberis TaxID=2883169 RepID=UPI001D0AE659|nr:DUF732 domain-containing protein [Corynebacterium uberis]UDL73410.1 DUF732 domain-containing protein [Corynebacterium uberis]
MRRIPRLRRLALAGVCGAVALATAACSGTTANNTDPDPAAASKSASSAGANQESGAPGVTSLAPGPSNLSDGNDQGDLGAREVDSVPAQQGANTPEEHSYIDAVAARGVDVAPAEDQLIAAAQAVCTDQAPQEGGNVTALAIGGQLVEQGLTTLSAEDAAKLIESSAREHYCKP